MANYYQRIYFNNINPPNIYRIINPTQNIFYNSPQVKEFSTIAYNIPKNKFINNTVSSPFLVEDEKISINSPMINTYNINAFQANPIINRASTKNYNFNEGRKPRFFLNQTLAPANNYLNYNNGEVRSNTVNYIPRPTEVPRTNKNYYNFGKNDFILDERKSFSKNLGYNSSMKNMFPQTKNITNNIQLISKMEKEPKEISKLNNKENIDNNKIISNEEINKNEEKEIQKICKVTILSKEGESLNNDNKDIDPFEQFLDNDPLKLTANLQNNNTLMKNGQNFNRAQFANSAHLPNIPKQLNNNFGLIDKQKQQIQPISPFLINEGEILSNPICNEYFRKTNTAPVTSYGYCQNQNAPNRNYMEDEGRVIENFTGDPNKILFCIFDGHGGHKVSKYLQLNFYKYMKKIVNYNDLNLGFTQLFRAIDNSIKALDCPTVGSTATIVYIIKQPQTNKRILYCANVGDSRCVLVNKKGVYRLSYDDRVRDPMESERINKNGGIIVNNRVYGQLMLSRSFGDWRIKDMGVIVDPHIVSYELKEDDSYCVIASDGVWDVLKDEECSFLEKMNVDTGKMSKIIIEECIKRKSLDNLSIFIISLN